MQGQICSGSLRKNQDQGHVSHRLSHLFLMFLRRDFSEGVAEVTGECVNIGARHGVEVPC